MSDIDPRNFVNQFFMILKTAQIHDPSNRAFLQPLQNLQNLIEKIIESEGQIQLESVETNLYMNEEKIRTDISTFATFKYLFEEFERKEIGGIVIRDIPSTEELTKFVRIFVRLSDPSMIGADSINEQLAQESIQSIAVLDRLEKRSVAKEDIQSKRTTQKRQALKNYVKAIDLVKDSAEKIKGAQAYETRKAKRIVYNLVDICLEEGFSFFGLSNIKNYDEYTFNHSVNVCVIAIGFGKNLGLSKRQIGELGIAALYHDYGKLAIPREILNKPGRFDSDEWEIMKSHPIMSVKTLLSSSSIQELDIKKMIAAFEHHRSYDCTGYPETGVKKPMNFYSRVVAISDAYDAMTTNRVYQRAMLPTTALKILLDNAGTKFDPLLVKAFINTVGIYPVGSLLRLTDSSLAVVAAVHKDPAKIARPIVQLVANASGSRVENGPEIDLSDDEQNQGLAVETVLRPEEYHINVAHYLFSDVADQLTN